MWGPERSTPTTFRCGIREIGDIARERPPFVHQQSRSTQHRDTYPRRSSPCLGTQRSRSSRVVIRRRDVCVDGRGIILTCCCASWAANLLRAAHPADPDPGCEGQTQVEAVGAGLAPMRRRRLRPLVSEEQTGEGGRRGVPARGRFQIWPTFARAAWIGHEYVRRLSMHVQRHPHGCIILAAAASPIESESPLFGPLPLSPLHGCKQSPRRVGGTSAHRPYHMAAC